MSLDHVSIDHPVILPLCKAAVIVVLEAAFSSLQSPAQATSAFVELFSVLVSHLSGD